MIKMIIAGVWTCVVLLGSMYGATMLSGGHATVAAAGTGGAAAAAAPRAPASADIKKGTEIEVPMIAGGQLRGYIVARFNYTLNSKVQSAIDPGPFLLDEAFREIYASPTLDFLHIAKVDLTKLTKDLVQNVNAHLEATVLQDVLVEEFNYVSKEDMQK